MCDNIANGQMRVLGGGGGGCTVNLCQPPIPPMIYISNGNSLNTFYGLSASNLYSCSAYTTDLYISGNVYGANLVSVTGNGYGLTNLNANALVGTVPVGTLPISGVVAGDYGNFSNVSSLTVDTYGRITAASNVAILSSQWTTIGGNVAYQNGVSIGTLSNPPVGSNLYVLGTANVDTLNVGYLTVNSAVVYGASTLNVYGTTNCLTIVSELFLGNASGLSNLNVSNLTGTPVFSNLVLTNSLQTNNL